MAFGKDPGRHTSGHGSTITPDGVILGASQSMGAEANPLPALELLFIGDILG